MSSDSVHRMAKRYTSFIRRPMTSIQVAAAVVDSSGSVLLGDGVDGPSVAEVSGDRPTAQIIEEAAGLVASECGLRMGVHVVPVGVMSAEQAAQSGIVWVLFAVSDCACDAGSSAALSIGRKDGAVAVRWVPLQDAVDMMPSQKRAAYQSLAEWALSCLEGRSRVAQETDLAGQWARVASRSRGLVAALLARGLTEATAVAEASRPYVQHWQRDPAAPTSWVVTTFGPPVRTLIYPLGDWEETYHGASVLFRDGRPGELLRRTNWLPEPDASPQRRGEEREGEAQLAGGCLLPPSCVAHTTFSSREFGSAEAVARYLRGGEMVVRRTYFPRPLSVMAATGELPVVSEEVFVRTPAAGNPTGACE